MATNRQIVAQTRKGLKNVTVKETSTGKKKMIRVGLPTFDAVSGALNKSLIDLQNVFIEGDMHEIDDVLTGTFTIGLRYYSKEADGVTDRKEPFFRYELIEQVDVEAEREEAMHEAKLNVLKATAKSAGKKVEANEEITDKW